MELNVVSIQTSGGGVLLRWVFHCVDGWIARLGFGQRWRQLTKPSRDFKIYANLILGGAGHDRSSVGAPKPQQGSSP